MRILYSLRRKNKTQLKELLKMGIKDYLETRIYLIVLYLKPTKKKEINLKKIQNF